MDGTMQNTLFSQSRTQKHKNYRHLQTDPRSVGTLPGMPQTRLKTKMLGGQAKTIWRLGGNYQR